MASIFVNYRREDRHFCDRLNDFLVSSFGKNEIFRDTGSLKEGEDFEKQLEIAISDSKVILVLIGSKWLEELQRKESSSEKDYAKFEIETALKFSSKTVIPILIDEQKMPASHILPVSIQKICLLHAFTIKSDPSFPGDFAALANVLKGKCPGLKSPSTEDKARGLRSRQFKLHSLHFAIVAFLALWTYGTAWLSIGAREKHIMYLAIILGLITLACVSLKVIDVFVCVGFPQLVTRHIHRYIVVAIVLIAILGNRDRIDRNSAIIDKNIMVYMRTWDPLGRYANSHGPQLADSGRQIDDGFFIGYQSPYYVAVNRRYFVLEKDGKTGKTITKLSDGKGGNEEISLDDSTVRLDDNHWWNGKRHLTISNGERAISVCFTANEAIDHHNDRTDDMRGESIDRYLKDCREILTKTANSNQFQFINTTTHYNFLYDQMVWLYADVLLFPLPIYVARFVRRNAARGILKQRQNINGYIFFTAIVAATAIATKFQSPLTLFTWEKTSTYLSAYDNSINTRGRETLPADYRGAFFCAGGTRLAVQNNDQIKICDINMNSVIRLFYINNGPGNHFFGGNYVVNWLADDRRFILRRRDGSGLDYIYDTNGSVAPFEKSINRQARPIEIHPDGEHVILEDSDGRFYTYDVSASERDGLCDIRRKYTTVKWSPDGSKMAIDYQHVVSIIDIASPAFASFILAKNSSDATMLDWSPDGSHLAVLSGNTIKIWNIDTRLPVFNHQQTSVTQIAWSPDGAALATAHSDMKIRIWSIPDGNLLFESIQYEATIAALCWPMSNARTLLICCDTRSGFDVNRLQLYPSLFDGLSSRGRVVFGDDLKSHKEPPGPSVGGNHDDQKIIDSAKNTILNIDHLRDQKQYWHNQLDNALTEPLTPPSAIYSLRYRSWFYSFVEQEASAQLAISKLEIDRSLAHRIAASVMRAKRPPGPKLPKATETE
ncbi:toll/interleukin-1 receptor domain-containing protein [Fimbriiglobus ruber]|uniref:TolB protein periplasmic protein n=1 Tax=Fimbriiglobus ruber TaxID=1908690 RepID=A0A225DGG1_9BACT|nr:toll/interleukin-1 receptor domain-containing protein [Fimbriiglobus ruber]OWK40552.1 tolB protein precursor periplasmic protein [Fimbriiglobus ruber]